MISLIKESPGNGKLETGIEFGIIGHEIITTGQEIC